MKLYDYRLAIRARFAELFGFCPISARHLLYIGIIVVGHVVTAEIAKRIFNVRSHS